MEVIDLTDTLLIAEAITGTPAKQLLRDPHVVQRLDAAVAAPNAGFGDQEFFPTLAEKAAILCARIAKNHPLPDGNKRLGWLAMRDFLARNGYDVLVDAEEAEDIVKAVITGAMTEDSFARWIAMTRTPVGSTIA